MTFLDPTALQAHQFKKGVVVIHGSARVKIIGLYNDITGHATYMVRSRHGASYGPVAEDALAACPVGME